MNETEVEKLLAEAVASFRQLPAGIGVSQIISAVTDFRVIPLSDDVEDKAMIQSLAVAARSLIESSKEQPIKTPRVNELGNAIEEPLLNACRVAGLNATWPARANGGVARTGYPDIAIDIDGPRPTYLEAKVIKSGSEGSSFRAFYLSPSENPKVVVDARHLLIAFTHQRRDDSEDGFEQYQLNAFKIIDLSHVYGKIKFEYQASNRDMYLGDAVIDQG